MRQQLKQLWAKRWVLRTLCPSILFNLRHLPLRQALHLPILLYKTRIIANKGSIEIRSKQVHFGMIQLGVCMVPLYPNTGIIYENRGGHLIFEGHCHVGAHSAICIGRGATLQFGDDFVASASVKIICFKGIHLGKKCRLGWDNMILDTNFHPLYNIEKSCYKQAYGAIRLGDYNWLGNQCVVMHSVHTPARCIFGLRSVLTRGAYYESFAVHGGSPLRVLTRGVMRDYEHDFITDYNTE